MLIFRGRGREFWVLSALDSLTLSGRRKGDQGGEYARLLSGLDRGVKRAVEFKLPPAGARVGSSEDNGGDGH